MNATCAMGGAISRPLRQNIVLGFAASGGTRCSISFCSSRSSIALPPAASVEASALVAIHARFAGARRLGRWRRRGLFTRGRADADAPDADPVALAIDVLETALGSGWWGEGRQFVAGRSGDPR